MQHIISRLIVFIISLSVLTNNAMIVDQDLVTPAGLSINPLNAVLEADQKDFYVILEGDSTQQANPAGDSLITYDVHKHRVVTLHFIHNIVLIGDPIYNFVIQKIGCGKRKWIIEPGNSVIFQPNVNNTVPVNLSDHAIWKGKAVYNIEDQNLLLKRDIELPSGDTTIEAKHEDIIVRLDRSLTLKNSSHSTSRLHFYAHKNRVITIIADKTLEFLGDNHQLIFIEEGCGTVQWEIPAIS